MNRESTDLTNLNETTDNLEVEANIPAAVQAALDVLPEHHSKQLSAMFLAGMFNQINKLGEPIPGVDIGTLGEALRKFLHDLEIWGLPGLIGIFGAAAGWVLPGIFFKNHDKTRYVARAALWYATYQIVMMGHSMGASFIPHLINQVTNIN